jgi:hypothetical protein
MKNIFIKTFFIFVCVSILLSCQKDESLDPRPLIVNGQYVRLDITNRILDFDSPTTTYFGGTVSAPANNIKKYKMFVKRRSANVFARDYVEIPLDISSFPYELKITPQLIATTLGLQITDLKQDDVFFFNCESEGIDGRITTYNNLSSVIKNQGSMKQGYRVVTQILKGQDFTLFENTFNNYDFTL